MRLPCGRETSRCMTHRATKQFHVARAATRARRRRRRRRRRKAVMYSSYYLSRASMRPRVAHDCPSSAATFVIGCGFPARAPASYLNRNRDARRRGFDGSAISLFATRNSVSHERRHLSFSLSLSLCLSLSLRFQRSAPMATLWVSGDSR